MNNIASYLENLEFEGYYNYESQIRSFNDNDNDQYHFELMAFQFVTKNSMDDGYDYGIQSYFKPFYEFSDNIYPSLTKISCEALKYWQKRCDESKKPYLIARYADLVWNFSKLHNGCVSEPINYALKAIDNYMQFSNENINRSTELDIKNAIIRALNLAKTLNQKDKLNAVFRKMIEIEKSMEDEYIGLWGFCFDELIEKGASISNEIENEIIESIQLRVNRLVEAEKEGNVDNFHAIEYGVSKLTKYYFKKGYSDKVTNYLNLIEDVIDTSTYAQLKEFRYNKLLELHHAVQSHRNDKKIIRKITDTAKVNTDNLKETSITTSIKKEEYEAFVNSYYTGNLVNDLKAVSVRFIPNIKQNLRMVEERRDKGIGLLSELIAHVKINKDGMPIATMDLTKEQDRLANQVGISIGIQTAFFNDVFNKLISAYELNSKKLGEVLIQSPILIEENNQILLSALESYFDENYISFIHTAVPYIEATLRNVIHLTGDSIYKLNKNGSDYDAISLGDILTKDYVENIMTKDLVYYLKFLYIDKKGFNIRNVVAHGLAHPSLFNKANADLIMHTLFTFLLFEEQKV